MKTFRDSVVVSIVFMLAVCRTVRAEYTNNSSTVSAADIAWNEVQLTRIPPKPPLGWNKQAPTPEQMASYYKQLSSGAIAAAEKAKDFYKRFPDSTNAITAKKMECIMLQTAFSYGSQNVFIFRMWADAQDAMLLDSKLSDEDKFSFREAIIGRTRSDPQLDRNEQEIQIEKDIRLLIKDYPQKDRPYEMLINFGANAVDTKARAIASEVLTFPTSENIKIKAEGILRRLDAVGKPLDIKFTALDGGQIDLSQMKGKVVLVDFWATWCGPCVGEIPNLKEVYENFHGKGFEVIGISFDSDKNALERFIQRNKLFWPQYFDGKTWQNKFGIQYGIASIPTTWLVDKKGNLREMETHDDLKGKIEKLLQE